MSGTPSSTATSPKVARAQSVASIALFEAGQLDAIPAIGGLVLTSKQSEFLLPPEVVLYEPGEGEIQRGGKPAAPGKPGVRLIFLNVPLTQNEQNELAKLHDALKQEEVITAKGRAELPEYVRLHALRILQQSKWRTDKALTVMATHLEMRVQQMPIREEQVLTDLQSCMMYWHGRDRSCRPILVWRMQEVAAFDVDRATKLILFILEFAVRYLMVPGRVESWILLVDLANCGWSVATSSATRNIARNVTRLLEEVYCGRNFCTKIFHMPAMIRAIVNSVIPEDKKSKVEFVADGDIATSMRKLAEPHQLEKQYGGMAPDVVKGQVWPFRFFSELP
mmetsp:Transcript_40379/g.72520  ORF Transcript_40379/g.72520 Transcript_40379/m.72520 type:complete len:336 (-) Transcript_40379:567-1574(-)